MPSVASGGDETTGSKTSGTAGVGVGSDTGIDSSTGGGSTTGTKTGSGVGSVMTGGNVSREAARSRRG